MSTKMLSLYPSFPLSRGYTSFQFAFTCKTTNFLQNPVSHCFDQCGSPPRLKPVCGTAFRLRT